MRGKDDSGNVTVAFRYNPQLVERVRTIEGRKWHKDEKYRSFPNTDGTLTPHSPLNLKGDEGGLVFKGEEIHLNPALQAELSSSSIISQLD